MGKETLLDLLTLEEKNKILYEFNDTKADYPRNKTIHKLFEEQVEKTPNSIVVIYGDKQLTFKELNDKSNQLARKLRKAGVKPDDIVGLIVDRSIEMIIGLLGVLKAGGAYLPIDPDYPQDRIEYMLEDSQTSILLTKSNLIENMDIQFTGNTIDLEDEEIYKLDKSNIDNINKPTDLAYIIYTSGTTGKPKGVMIEHKNVVRLMFNDKYLFDFNEKDVWTMFHSYCFDFSVWEMYGALLYGGKLVIIPKMVARDTKEFLNVLKKEEVTVLNQTPSAFYRLINEDLGNGIAKKQQSRIAESHQGQASKIEKDLNIRYVIFGGEALKPSKLKEWKKKYKETKLINMYGITETTVHVTFKEIKEEEIKLDISNIGKPIPTLTTYVLDKNLNLLPIGVPGELCVGGEGVTRGYLNRPKLTEEKFVINPYKPEEKIYRSGDLVRLLDNGEMEYLGRIDHQVKIRGFRIELGEIESKLLEYEDIKDAIVLAREDDKGSKYLCGYVVADKEMKVKELREHLLKELPEYMVPQYFVQLDSMPLTSNGKTNRKALPEPDGSMDTGTEYVPPQNETEKKIVQIWSEVLKVDEDKIGIEDKFFELGGHSLKAVNLVSKIQKELNLNLKVSDIFEKNTIKDLAELLKDGNIQEYEEIKVLEEKEYYETSLVQKRMYAINQRDKESTNYNIPETFVLDKNTNEEKLEEALRELISRHESFRTSFEVIDGEVMQKIDKEVEFELRNIEIKEDSIELIDKSINNFIKPFDLGKAPLIRGAIIDSKDKKVFVLDMHHIIMDGVSLNIIMEELRSLYEGKSLEEVKVQYKDFAKWQNNLYENGGIVKQEEYWLDTLKGELPVLNMPTDYSRPSVQSFEGSNLKFDIGKELTKKIDKVIKRTGITKYMFFLAAFNVLLSKYTGQEDIIIGTPTAGRTHASLENIVGMFVNTLPLRNNVQSDSSFKELLNELKENSIKAFENQDYELGIMIDKLGVKNDISKNSLIDVMFTFENFIDLNIDKNSGEGNSLKLTEYQIAYDMNISKFDITLALIDDYEQITGSFEYSTKLYKEQTIKRLIDSYKNILKEVVNNLEVEIKDIEVMNEEAKKRLLYDFNDTKAEYPKDKTIQEIFEKQVEKNPDKIALVFEDREITYRELNERSNQVARKLRENGVQPNDLVAIMLDHSFEMIVSIMGILKSGGAYVPIDPSYPEDRIEYMINDSKAKILITKANTEIKGIDSSVKDNKQSVIIEGIDYDIEVIRLDGEDIKNNFKDNKESTKKDNEEESSNLEIINTAHDLAYIIYTSGSTGKPKGVMIEHKSAINTLYALENAYPVNENDGYLLKTAYTFDVSVTELFGWFVGNGKLVILKQGQEKDPKAIYKTIKKNNVTHINFAPSALNMFINTVDKDALRELDKLEYIMVAGEAFSKDLAEKCRHIFDGVENIHIENIYGPTEATIYTTKFSLSDLEDKISVPIGQPIDNIKTYVLDKDNNLALIGVAGELCIAGIGLARGYLNRTELTEEKFVENPYNPEEKMYRSGDLVRWLPDGNIEFLGRIDHQVKIRGFRIELGEIENQLLNHKDVIEAVVVAREDEDGNKYLCGYIVGNEEIAVGELKKYLGKKLPDYMIPSYIIQLNSMPLNQSGKIDRKALPVPDVLDLQREYVAPRNEIEKKIAQIWSEVLKIDVDKVGIEDKFFDLGGHSLKAVNLVYKIQKEFNSNLQVSDIFEKNIIKDLAELLKDGDIQEYEEIKVLEEKEYYETSLVQKRMYAINKRDKESTNYNIPKAVILDKNVNEEKLEGTLRELLSRHESLRTSFEVIEGEVMQKINEEVEFELEHIDINGELEKNIELINQSINNFIKPFDLEKALLMRGMVIELQDKKILILDMHHIIIDGVSLNTIMNELESLYEGKSLEEVKVQYKDFADWQNKLYENGMIAKQEQYWLEKLKGELPVLNMPTDYSRPSVQNFEGSNLKFKIGKELTKKIDKVIKRTGITKYMFFLAAFNVLLSKYAGQEDIIIGTPTAGRTHASVENTVGMFVNTLPLRNNVQSNKSFEEFLNELKENSINAFENQDYELGILIDKLGVKKDTSKNPLFDVMFTFENFIDLNTDKNDDKENSLNLTEYEITYDMNISKFDITLALTDNYEQISGLFEYSTKLYKEETIKRLIDSYKNILKEVVDNLELEIKDIEMIDEEEKKKLLYDFNDTKAEYPKDKTIQEIFEEQVEKNPDKVALVFENREMTYRELNEYSNQVARKLRASGVKPNDLVAIMLNRSFEMIIGIMGILKSGGAYVPIDPSYPEDRIEYMLNDSKAKILIAKANTEIKGIDSNVKDNKQSVIIEGIDYDIEVIRLDGEDIKNNFKDNKESTKKDNEDESSNLEIINTANDLAYIIYTSGSTGKPKGVMIEHKSAINTLYALENAYPVNENDGYLLKTAYTFDVSVTELFGWFVSNGKLVILKQGHQKDPNAIYETIKKNNVTHINFAPSAFNMFINVVDKDSLRQLDKLKYVMVAGEAFSKDLAEKCRHIFDGVENIYIENIYGPTEATIYTTKFSLSDLQDRMSVPIGQPINNIKTYVLDKDNNLAPIGVPGELYISGCGVGRGYLNRPELTEEKFVENPYNPEEKMYRSGDLVRWLPDGNIEFLGRIDHQVKIRGFRIELGEIENQLLNHKDVKETVVVAREDEDGNKYLCGYIVGNEEISVGELKKYLGKKLPEYMIPSYIIQLNSMPLNQSGKIDRKALPVPDILDLQKEYVAPRNELEKKIAQIWSEVLKIDVEKIGIDDSFFELGGHSLKVVNLVYKLQKEFSLNLQVSDVFDKKTIKDLAEFSKDGDIQEYEEIKVLEEKEYYETSLVQKRMYAINQRDKESTNYNIPKAVILDKNVNEEKLERTLRELISRHESLRTSFEVINGEIMQKIYKEVEFELEYIKINGESKESAKSIDEVINNIIRPFNLGKAPLIRGGIIDLKDKKILILDMHHIIMDGVSLNVIMEELRSLYEGKSLEEVKVQYKDFADWQNKLYENGMIAKQEEYWLERLNGELSVLNMPTDYNRPAVQSFEGSDLNFEIKKELTQKIETAIKRTGTTKYMFFLAAFNVLLSKYAGQEDIIIGTPTAGRTHASVENTVGMFVNTLPLRNNVQSNKSFKEFLNELKENSINAFENQEYELGILIDKLGVKKDTSKNPLFDVMFTFENFIDLNTDNNCDKENSLNLTEYEITYDMNISKFDITLALIDDNEQITGLFEYSTKLYKEETIKRFIDGYKNILKEVVNNLEVEIKDIEVMNETEKEKILNDFNNTKVEYPKDKTVKELFEEVVKQAGEKFAVVSQGMKLSYKELNERSNQIANVLRKRGVKADSIVGILCDRSIETIIGILGIIKAGGAYLPIDEEYPETRVKYMLKDSNSSIILGKKDLLSKYNLNELNIELVDIESDEILEERTGNLDCISSSDDLIYIMYTSGSTGKPKGVCVKHKNVVRLVRNSSFIEYKEDDKILQTGSMAFDASTFEVWGSLLNSLQLHVGSKNTILDTTVLKDYLKENEITICWFTAALFNQLCQEDINMFKPLRYLLTGGDVVSSKYVSELKAIHEELKVIDGYGPTENTTFSTTFTIDSEWDESIEIPIGKPISNSTAYIMDKNSRLLPIGVAGELCVGGDGVARGYLNRSELTKEKFIDNPYVKDEKIYRTGDLAKWLPDGNIEFLGRIDNQVKIRGFRIELGEIETVLFRYKEIKETVVVAKDDRKGNKYLCAYYVSEKGLDISQLREHISKKLPEYMIPSYFIKLEELPLTSNGKIDKKALPELEGKIDTGIEYEGPRNEVEKKLVDIWQEVLGVENIGINDNFFDLGGHSLKAINIIAKIHKEFNVGLQIKDLFDNITIKSLGIYIQEVEGNIYSSIEPAQVKKYYQLSAAQRRIYTVHQLDQYSISYNIPNVFTIEGNLDKKALEKAFKTLIERHESFRTSFEIIEGEIVQKINDTVEFKIEDVEIEEQDIKAEVDKSIKPFDLSQAPLLRVKLANLKENKSILMIDMHHIISDGVSINIFINELTTLYEDRKLENCKIQYKDYALWQNKITKSVEIEKQEKYWLNQFKGEIPILNLPTDYKRPSLQSFEGSIVECEISEELTIKLKEVSKETNSTVNMVLLAAYNILLSKYSGQDDIILGTVTAGRTHSDLDSVIGMFVNTLAIRNYPQGEKTFIEFLKEVKNTSLEAYENQEYQFEELVDKLDIKRDITRNPLFDTMFVMQNMDKLELKMKNLRVKPYTYHRNVSNFDLTLTAVENEEKIVLNLEYCTELFREETIIKLSKHFINIIKNIIDKKNIKLKDIDILSNKEKQRLLIEFNDTHKDYLRNKTIQELFEEQVEKTPYNVAVVCENKKLTYRELNEKANHLGSILREKGVKTDELVAIMVERSIDMIVGIMGILKAGGAYLPIDPEYPQNRVEYMLEDSMVRLLLTQKHLSSNFKMASIVKEVINIDEEKIYSKQGQDSKVLLNLEPINKPTDLAYVIYTSGSTGNPKGVMIENRNVVNYINAFLHEFKLTEKDTILQQASFSFDAFTEELYPILMAGGKIIIPKKEDILDIKELKEIIDEHKATIISCSPLLLNELNKLPLSESMKIYINGGDVLKKEYISNILEGGKTVYNTYGPTESTVCATYYRCTGSEEEYIPIGKPISNYEVYILDDNRNLLPIGVPGELCISGDGLGRGYLNRPELTDEKFVKNPFNPNKKMYRSGDLVKWMEDGNIEFLGRIDHQVKIRGFRIELGEIETALTEINEIEEAVVVAKSDKNGNKYLCAYYVSEKGLDISKLREDISKKLPEYMIPSYFIKLEKVPLTSNGKIDKNALPKPEGKIDTGIEYEASRNEVEEKLVGIWQEVLGVENIGINDNFFDLGGHSLKAINIIAKIHKEFNVELRIKDLFDNLTIKSMGTYIQELEGHSYSPIDPAQVKEYYQLSAAQRRLYTVHQLDKYSISYNMPNILTIEGNLDKKALEKAFKTLIERHESFRTSFEIIEGEIVQKINDTVEFKIIDVEIEEKDIKTEVDKFIKPFDLSQAPLLRVKLANIKENKNILMIDMHHIISDGVSYNVFTNELTTLYEGKKLVDSKIQYKDYAVWQSEIIKSKKIEKQEKYWLNQFKGEIPILNLPTDYNRPSLQSFKGSSVKCEISKELSNKLKEVSKETNSTVHMVLLAAYNILLSKYCGQEDIIIGTVTAGRTHSDLESVIGMFINTLAIRNYPQGEKTFIEFLKEIKNTSLEAYENQEYQFEELVDKLDIKRDITRNPLFDTTFVMQNIDEVEFKMKDLKVETYSYTDTVSKFDLALVAVENEEKIVLNLEYCTELFKEETIIRLLKHFINIINNVVDKINIKLKDIDVLSNKEKQQLLMKFNDTDMDYPKDKTIQELFEEQVEKTPDNIAVVYENKKLTYRKLNEKANQIARLLREKGVKADELIAIMVERSLDMIIGIIGILKAGGAYLPIDPEYPQDRIKYMLKDSNTMILLTQKNLEDKIAFEGYKIILDDEKTYTEDSSNLIPINEARDLVYVIYTSGTTGKAKGVMIENDSLINLVWSINERIYGKSSGYLNIAQISPYVFDASVKQIFPALLFGHSLCIMPEKTRMSGRAILEYYEKYKINVSDGTPSHMLMVTQALSDTNLSLNAEVFLIGGEALSLNVCRDFYRISGKENVKIFNVYGPTECTDVTTSYCITSDKLEYLKEIPIGTPIGNKKVHILNNHDDLVPIGVSGEIYISGHGLSRGYLNRSELTAQKFIDNPFNLGEKMYKTGDLARWLPDGSIEFLGRADNQVKIRGYRIELGEIETVLLRHSEIKETVVVAKDDKQGNRYLCAYYVSEKGLDISQLREHISKELPEYMIPSYFIKLEEIPLTANGKIDRKALPKPEGKIDTGIEYEAPRNEVEEKLVGIWQEILGVENIGINDNFFDLGGHSLKAINIIAKIHKEFNVELRIKDLFDNLTIKSLGKYLQEVEENIYSSIEPAKVKEHYQLSPVQRRIYTVYQLDKYNISYNIPNVFTIEGNLDKKALEKAFKTLIERHESFRTSFEIIEGEVVQKINDTVEFKIEDVEIEEKDIKTEVDSFIKPFDLSQVPLLRVKLAGVKENKSILMIDMHHIISDGVSINIFINELTKLYEDKQLTSLKIQYKDYAIWQSEIMKSGKIEEQEKYWLNQFKGEIPILNLPIDHNRPSLQSSKGSSVECEISKELTNKLKEVSKETSSTVYMVLLAAYNILLSKYSGQEDIIIGTIAAGRTHPDLENVIGMFVNTLVIRNYPQGEKTFIEFLKEVKDTFLGAYQNQDYQFEDLVDKLDIKRDITRNPLFDTMFIMQNMDKVKFKMKNLKVESYSYDYNVSKFDLALAAIENEENITLNVDYCTDLFKEETIKRLLEDYKSILYSVVGEIKIKNKDICILNKEEKNSIQSEINTLDEFSSMELDF